MMQVGWVGVNFLHTVFALHTCVCSGGAVLLELVDQLLERVDRCVGLVQLEAAA